ncbi:MAG: FeoB-associated Cys-rich membrane protein [Syntrophomonadaceae bacterium]|nr:FeoB-associated Cys-rich membrane protein [Syntrophomonadaceae bacterium]
MDQIIVGLLIACAAVYILRRIYKTITRPGCDSCGGGCEGCKIHMEENNLK